MKNKLINRGNVTEIHIESKHGHFISLIDTNQLFKLDGVTSIHIGKDDKVKNYYNVLCRKDNTAIKLSRLLLGIVNPKEIVDHKNRNPLDNRNFNLRVVTNEENLRNRNPQHNSKSGVRGICWRKREQRWNVRFTYKKKVYDLGYFKDLEEAKQVKEKFEKEELGIQG